MKVKTITLSGALLAAAVASAAQAHHSNAMFDHQAVMQVDGTVSDFQWTNPHVWIELEIPNKQGSTTHYTIEGPTPAILRSRGWKFNALKAGDKVQVKVHPLNNGMQGGSLISVMMQDGKVLAAEGPGGQVQ